MSPPSSRGLESLNILALGILALWGIFSNSIQSLAAESPGFSHGATNVTIPNFGADGKISWELKAEEILLEESSIYQMKEPSLKMMTEAETITKASSQAGVFDLNQGSAHGGSTLKILGDIFHAQGSQWSWQELPAEGKHHLTFASDAYVHFQTGLNPVLAKPDRVEKKTSTMKKEIESTQVTADEMEFFAMKKGGYRFILDGNVSIQSESLKIECMEMEILMEQDRNQSGGSYGRIAEVRAKGEVKMRQTARVCMADSLILDTINGKGLLTGNARVEDAEWGVVTGEKVELDRESGKARVLGDKDSRPRLEIPNLGKIKLPGFKSDNQDSK